MKYAISFHKYVNITIRYNIKFGRNRNMFSENYISSVKLNDMYSNEIKSSYLKDVASVKFLLAGNAVRFSKNVTFIIGENGSGKSTLLEAIAVAYGFNPEGGTINMSFSTHSSHSDLYKYLKIGKNKRAKDGFFLRAEGFYNVASHIDNLDNADIPFAPPLKLSYGGISLHEQSHGESFLATVQNRFSGNGLYILDEPEAALSPMKLLTLLAEIKYLTDNNSQFIISTHSPILMAYPNAEIYEIRGDGIFSVSYKDTEHYRVTKSFLDNPDRTFKYLFS